MKIAKQQWQTWAANQELNDFIKMSRSALRNGGCGGNV